MNYIARIKENQDVVLYTEDFFDKYPDLVVGWEVVELTEEEETFIKNCKLPKRIDGVFVDSYVEVVEVPEEISKMALSLELLDRGITDQDIFDDIDSIPDSMFPAIEKQKAKVKYITARTFERTNADLNLVATMEGLSQEDVNQIFINGKSR